MSKLPIFSDLEELRDTLPADLRPDLPNVQPAGRTNEPASPQRSLHVLCVDDDESILEMMKDCLTHFGHRVKVASGGKYGIELFSTAILKSEPYDVVITDLGMPDVNGYRVARTIKDESPDTPIIMMTGEGAAGKEGGAVDVVVCKPPCIQELNDLLLRLATQKS
jgi:CheY-like chemotaxis protein